VYHEEVITFFCGIRGAKRLEFNTLIRTEYFLADPEVSWIQVTGADCRFGVQPGGDMSPVPELD
jgi:hypothetical protein